MRWIGLLPVTFYVIHGVGRHALQGRPDEMLWACHVANLLVAAGWIARRPVLNSAGFLWLVAGNSLWILTLVEGEPFICTTALTHIGGIFVAGWGVRRDGMKQGSWWFAILAFLLLLGATRLATRPCLNVNLAFKVHPGWEGVFPNHFAYLAALVFFYAGVFFSLEKALRFLLERLRVRRMANGNEPD